MGENGEFTYVERNIYLYNNITKESALDIVSRINSINEYDEIVEEAYLNQFNELVSQGIVSPDGFQGLPKREPIFLEINSGGGATSAGFSIVSAIENSETPVIGYVTGDCMSMAIAVLASCHYRISSEYANFMIHDIYSIAEGKFNDINSSMEYMRTVRDTYKKFVVANTDISKEELDKLTDANADFYFSPEKAKEFGLVDSLDTERPDEELLIKKLYHIQPIELDDDKARKIEPDLEHITADLDGANIMFVDNEDEALVNYDEMVKQYEKVTELKSLARKLVDKLDSWVK